MSRKRLIAFILFPAASFVALCLLVIGDQPELRQVDQLFYSWCAQLDHPLWVQLNLFFSFLGKGVFLVVIGGLVMIFLMVKGFIKGGIHYIIALILGMKLNALIKLFFMKARPDAYTDLAEYTSYSFPSGHAFGSLTFYALTFWFLKQAQPQSMAHPVIRYSIVFLTLMIGLSRVFLGVHWTSDVMGGFVWGLSWVFLNIFIARRLNFFNKPSIKLQASNSK